MLIVVEGCLGAGKSTVATGLAAYRGSTLLLEDFESNPFLRAFYEDPVGNALETEFAFLFLHFHQLKAHAERVSSSEVIADFHLGKDLIYADLNLQDVRTRRAFNDLYDVCLEKTPQPALLICLSASDGLLLQRIRDRRRDFEQDVDPTYYEGVNHAYSNFFKQYSGAKIEIPMDSWDFVKTPALFRDLDALIARELNLK